MKDHEKLLNITASNEDRLRSHLKMSLGHHKCMRSREILRWVLQKNKICFLMYETRRIIFSCGLHPNKIKKVLDPLPSYSVGRKTWQAAGPTIGLALVLWETSGGWAGRPANRTSAPSPCNRHRSPFLLLFLRLHPCSPSSEINCLILETGSLAWVGPQVFSAYNPLTADAHSVWGRP